MTFAPEFGNMGSHQKQMTSFVIEPAEVIDIIYDQSHPLYKKVPIDSEEQGVPIGSIKIRRYLSDRNKSYSDCPIATPLNPYSHYYPIKHEIVAIYAFPNKKSGTATQSYSFYYSDVASIYNLVNSNELPNSTSVNPSRDANEPITNFGGVPTNNTTKVNLGETFEQNIKVNDLLPFEGDIIHQGRWGNSIRFTSTITQKSSKNEWSKRGSNGDPLVIIQSNKSISVSPPNHVVEQIDSSAACIYLCDGQLIPLSVASTNLRAYEDKPGLPKSKESKQVIISSDRVIINAGPANRSGEVLIFGKNSIGLSSSGTINISSDKDFVVYSDKLIKMGSPSAEQSAILGEKFQELYNAILDLIQNHTHSTSLGPTSPPIGAIPIQFPKLKQKFELNALSKKVKLI